jgi:hypothetical protein
MSGTDSVTVTTRVAVDTAEAFRIFTEDVDRWWKSGPAYRFGEGREGVLRFESSGSAGERRLVEVFDEGSGDLYEVGLVRAWEPGTLLSFEFRGRRFAEDERTLVDVHFDEDAGVTRVTLIHRGWDSLPDDHPARHGLFGGSFEALIGGWWSMHLIGLRPRG